MSPSWCARICDRSRRCRKDELLALKRSIAELASIGRNINQIAKVANEGGGLPGSVREEFRAMLRICEALRDNTKALLKANLRSWSDRAFRSRRLGSRGSVSGSTARAHAFGPIGASRRRFDAIT